MFLLKKLFSSVSQWNNNLSKINMWFKLLTRLDDLSFYSSVCGKIVNCYFFYIDFSLELLLIRENIQFHLCTKKWCHIFKTFLSSAKSYYNFRWQIFHSFHHDHDEKDGKSFCQIDQFTLFQFLQSRIEKESSIQKINSKIQ